jgi:hypothetical protein
VKAVVQYQTKKNSGASQEYNAAIDFGDGLSEIDVEHPPLIFK